MRTFYTVSARAKLSVLALLLLLPVLYLAAHWTFSETVHATSGVQPGSASTTALSQAELRAKNEPTVDNRVNLSQVYIENKLYGRAVQVLSPLVQEAPRNAVAWNNLCVAHTLLMEYNLALDACNTGVKSDPSFGLLKNNLRWAQGERDKVIAALAAQENTEPSKRDAGFYMSEGLNQLHLGEYAQATAAWQRVLQLDPKNMTAWNNIGTAQMMQHHYADAKASFLRASALDPESQLVRNNLAWADSENGLRH